MNLSTHFTLEEMTRSQTGSRLGIDNTPGKLTLENLYRITETMEQVRTLLGTFIKVSSGYRSPDLNRKIGGSQTSAHCKGLACDFTAVGKYNYEVAIAIRDSSIVFDQLILEYGWVHIGLSDAEPRRQCLTKRSAASPYESGINL